MKKQIPIRYYTHAHNIEGCLRNGSFVRKLPSGVFVQYMNGDHMGTVDAVPKGMIEVPREKALKLLPECCR